MAPALSSLARYSSPGVCDTLQCQEISAILKTFVDLNVDPCSDFFQYTCGSWINSDDVKDQDNSFDLPTQTQGASLDYIIGILNGTFDDAYKMFATPDLSYHTDEQKSVDEKNWQMVKNYYDSCLATETNHALGATPLFPLLSEIENQLSAMTSTSLAKVLSYLTLENVQTFVKFQVTVNPLDHDYNILYINQPDLDASTTYTDIASLRSYSNLLSLTLRSVLGGPSDSNSDYEQLVMEESYKNNFTLWSPLKIESAVNNLIDFEIQLNNIIENLNSTLDDLNEVPTLEGLEATGTNVSWDTFFTTLVSEKFASNSDLQIIYLQEYVEKLEQLLSVTSVEVLQDYFTIHVVLSKLPSLNFPVGVTIPNSMTSSSGGLVSNQKINDIFRAPTVKDPATITHEEKCGGEASINFKHIIGRFFTLETFGASQEKKNVEEFVDVIYDAWLQDIKSAPWVDEKTRVVLIQKIDALRKFVAYSNTSPDWRNPTSIAEYYQGLTIDKDMHYFEALNTFDTWKNSKIWKSLEHKRDPNEWNDDNNYPHFFNAHYYSQFNKIEIPIGIWQKPLFHSYAPEYLNYGSIGSIIGHELVHSLDSNGRFYNASGYKEDLFSEATDQTYDEKSQCFVEQYNNFTLTGPSDVQLPLNGTNVLAENIADAGGLNIAYNAYQNYIKKLGKPEQTLPGFEHHTPEQLFFVSHGMFTCQILKKSVAKNLIANDVHAPLYFRNIGLFQNSAEFAKAFKCPVSSPMNPEKKCSIW